MKYPSSRRSWPTRKHLLLAGGVLLVIGGGIGLYLAFQSKNNPTAPTYNTVLPQDQSVDELGGWQRVSPPESEPVFAYNDHIDDIAINVSQQPIPESFAGNVGANVKSLAESYSATTVIEAGETTVYIGRSSRGPQSVIFTKNNLLVLIKSQGTIKHESWARYINALADPKSQTIPSF